MSGKINRRGGKVTISRIALGLIENVLMVGLFLSLLKTP
jgi:hypothetical protein